MADEKIIKEIFEKLKHGLPKVWDGKEIIEFMKANGSRQWKQMEWVGFYFQFMCERILGKDNFFEIPGKQYGRVTFDGFKEINYDFKAHSSSKTSKVPTNNRNETTQAIVQYGEVGFIIISGETEYDDDGSFKIWHDGLKGKVSKYELSRVERNAKSRPRKTMFTPTELIFVFLDKDTVNKTTDFQTGFRNSNGNARNPKIEIDLNNKELKTVRFKI
jgi:hypothetical protein